MSYKPSGNYVKEVCTASPMTGAATNADSLPTATANKNGTDDGAFTLTVTNIDTGRYKITGTIPSGYVKSDVLNVTVAATVGGIAGKAVVDTQIIDSKQVGDLIDAAALTDYQQRSVAVTLPTIPTDWIAAAGVKADAVTKIQAGLATPTNITAGTITTTTNLTNAPTAGDLTAAMKASVTTAASSATPAVTVSDKTGFTLTVTPPTVAAIRTEIDANSTQFASIVGSLAAFAGLQLTGTVASSPSPTGTAFTVTLDAAVSGSTVAADIIGLYLTFRGGAREPAARAITGCTVNSTTSLALTFTGGFAAAPATGNAVSISS